MQSKNAMVQYHCKSKVVQIKRMNEKSESSDIPLAPKPPGTTTQRQDNKNLSKNLYLLLHVRSGIYPQRGSDLSPRI